MKASENGLPLIEVLEQLPCHIYWVDLEGVTLGCNQQVADFFRGSFSS